MRPIDADEMIKEVEKNDSLPWNLDHISKVAFITCIKHMATLFDIRKKAEEWNKVSSKKVPYEFIDFLEGKRR